VSTSKYTPSKPFPNGSSYMFFNDAFCCRCNKYKLNADGMPLPDNCETENIIAEFRLNAWPQDTIVNVGDISHVCLLFENDDDNLMRQYRALFEEDGDIQ
jgi:hypothetical protein